MTLFDKFDCLVKNTYELQTQILIIVELQRKLHKFYRIVSTFCKSDLIILMTKKQMLLNQRLDGSKSKTANYININHIECAIGNQDKFLVGGVDLKLLSFMF